MRHQHRSLPLALPAALAAALFLLTLSGQAQITSTTDVNLSRMNADQSECAMGNDPTNKMRLFVACNTTGVPGLFAARSIDRGINWTFPDPTDKTIADGDAGQGPAACCDPTIAWDTFGNLYLTYINAALTSIVTLISTNGGATFNTLATFGPVCVQCVDQPTVVTANTTGGVVVWVVWNQNGSMVARGAQATALGVVGAFNPLQNIPGTATCSFGDIAISPAGAVVQVCESPNNTAGPANLLVNTDPDGLGPMPFGAAVNVTATQVGGFVPITPQNARTIDAEAGLAYDFFSTSVHFGRLYLVYTDAVALGSSDTDIFVRFSDDNGGTWSARTRVNDDAPGRAQFLPRIASNPLSGNIAICWHDCRNSATNTAMQEFCTMSTPPTFPAFMANGQVSDGASTSNGAGIEFGDYSGLAYFQGVLHPVWADTSNSGGLNPNGNANFDAYTDIVTGGAAANEGDPHITTVDNVHYNFQASGEFVALRDVDLEIQTRQTAVSTTFNPGPDPYDGLATCVSLNSAVAARVGSHRVTFEPNLSGVPDPNGMQLRVDGTLRPIGSGISLAPGLVKPSTNGGIEIDFPNGTILIVTPNFWSSQGKWYLNVDVSRTGATEGIMGSLAPGSWLPALPGGGSAGPMPAAIHDRYVVLNGMFADAWRVTDKSSLFDYASGTSTATFTIRGWPKESPPCDLPKENPAKPADLQTARAACADVQGKVRVEDCVFDVQVTGEVGFAKLYLLSQRARAQSTTVTVTAKKNVFTATVRPTWPGGSDLPPVGTITFVVNGEPGKAIPLERGRAVWTAPVGGRYRVYARYTPSRESGAYSSMSETIANQ